jgi:hypothetical protein
MLLSSERTNWGLRPLSTRRSTANVKAATGSTAVNSRQAVDEEDCDGMNSDQVNIKMVNDVPAIGASLTLEKGSELLVDSTTATALVLCGAAIQLSTE